MSHRRVCRLLLLVALLSLGHSFTGRFDMDKALVRVDYVYNNKEDDDQADIDDDANDGGEYQGWGLTTGLRMYRY